MTDSLTPAQFDASDGVEDWRVISDGACAFFRASSFAASAAFVEAIAALPRMGEPGTGVDIRHAGVTVKLLTQSGDWWGPSVRDVELARRISEIAREHGLEADLSAIQSLLVIPGAPDPSAVMPFWRAVLGYVPREDSPDEDLVDAHDRGPAFWFEGMKEPRADGGGAIHLAVWVPYEQAQARVDAAIAAGGHLVRDDHAPMWWTVADSAGNEADIATTKNRE
jgi:4a-hydroxytetrahydrobiopterin dehydratase